MAWEDIVSNIILFLIASGLISWTIKSILQNYIDKDFEKFKIQFSKLHETRAIIIGEMFSKLVDYEMAMEALTSPLQYSNYKEDEVNRWKNARQTGWAFYLFYLKNEIYFTEDLCKLLNDICEKYRDATIDFETKKHFEGRKEEMDYWIKSWQTVKKDVPPLKSALKKEFRSILGVQ